MEGLSSQRDIIQGVKSFAKKNNFAITVFASHRNERNEILSVADYSLTEPEDPQNVFSLSRNHSVLRHPPYSYWP